MIALLQETLKSFQNVEYLIKETKTRRLESYNIKQQCEMQREVDAIELSLTIYVVFSEPDETGNEIQYRGSYNTEIHPGTDEDKLREIISQGVFAAGFVKNEYYPLVLPSSPPSDLSAPQKIDPAQAMADLQAAFYESDNQLDGHISYSEFYITQSDIRIINSAGVDVGYTTHNVFVETAVHMPSTDSGEIEISESYNFSLDTGVKAAAQLLKNRVNDLFATAAKKAVATPTPTVGDINILLTGECLATYFSYYSECADAALVYQQLSTFKEGTEVQGGSASDRINLILDPQMQGSTGSRPYDDMGQPLKSHTIIENGKLIKYSGSTRFAHYMGIAPTGIIDNTQISGGTAANADLRKEPYLELVSFSDFQANPITGDFGSEIRLGFYYDGVTTVPVTGGSISGNMAKVHDTLRMSVETRQYNDYHGPATICIRGASISGV